jgi:hypothetical protein
MNGIEQQLFEKISHLSADQQQRVLEFVEELEAPRHQYSAQELMRLPPAQREAILRAQLEMAANEDFELFEAYSEEDLDAIP